MHANASVCKVVRVSLLINDLSNVPDLQMVERIKRLALLQEQP